MMTRESVNLRIEFLEKQNELKLKYMDGIIARVIGSLFLLSLWVLLLIILVGWMFD